MHRAFRGAWMLGGWQKLTVARPVGHEDEPSIGSGARRVPGVDLHVDVADPGLVEPVAQQSAKTVLP